MRVILPFCPLTGPAFTHKPRLLRSSLRRVKFFSSIPFLIDYPSFTEDFRIFTLSPFVEQLVGYPASPRGGLFLMPCVWGFRFYALYRRSPPSSKRRLLFSIGSVYALVDSPCLIPNSLYTFGLGTCRRRVFN